MDKMKILFVTDNFYPETNAPASRTFEHCTNWVKNGHKVQVITTVPNFPDGVIKHGYRNKMFQKEEINGIEIIRVWSFVSRNDGFFLRILDFLSFSITSFISSLFMKKPDIVIGTSPQFFTLFSAFGISKIKRVKWVLELRDLWPDSVVELGVMKKNYLFNVLKYIEFFLYKNADYIIPVTESFKKYLIDNGTDSKKIKVITNGVDTKNFFFKSKNEQIIKKYNLQNKFVVGYIGNHGISQNLDCLINAAEIFQDKNINEVFFIFIGSGPEKNNIKKLILEKNLKNILLLDNVSKSEIISFWSIMDVSVVPLKKLNIFKTVIPSKIFEAISMEVPIIIGTEGESKNLVLENEVGISYEPENHFSLYKAIMTLLSDEDLIKNIKSSTTKVKNNFDRNTLAEKMVEFINE